MPQKTDEYLSNWQLLGQSIQEITNNAKVERFTGVIVLHLAFHCGGLRDIKFYQQHLLTLEKK